MLQAQPARISHRFAALPVAAATCAECLRAQPPLNRAAARHGAVCNRQDDLLIPAPPVRLRRCVRACLDYSSTSS